MPDFNQHQAEQAREQDGQAEVDPRKLELFENFADFFKKDSDIKHSLIELAPSEQELYSGDGAVLYSDKLYEGVRDIASDINTIMNNFYKSDVIEERLKQITTDVVDAGANPDKLAQVYKNDFSAMSEDFYESVHKEIKGYGAFSNPHQFDDKVSSINEILHLVHSSIVNNENILQSLPVIEKTQPEGSIETIALYGTADSENPVAKGIYDLIKDSDESSSDIVSLKDRTLMMVRDRGHALTMDIEEDKNSGKYFVNYFIPKICNVEKVNQLPGVRKVAKKEGASQAREFTTGVFSVENEADVASAVVNFISMVPTDGDIER